MIDPKTLPDSNTRTAGPEELESGFVMGPEGGLAFKASDTSAMSIFGSDPETAAYGMFAGIFPGSVGIPPLRGSLQLLMSYSNAPWLRAVISKISNSVAMNPWALYTVLEDPNELEGRGGLDSAPGPDADPFNEHKPWLKGKRQRKAVRNEQLQRAGPFERKALLKAQAAKGNLREITSHPLLSLLNSSSQYLTGLTTRRLTQAYIDLVGEAFWVFERDIFGTPVSAWPIPTTWVVSTPTPTNPNYRISFRGWQGLIPETEILWFSDPDVVNPYYRGSGMSTSLSNDLDADEWATQHIRSFFFNRARPDVIITADGLKRSETERIEQDWTAKSQGFWRAYKPYFMNRKVDVTVLSQNFEDMQLVALRQHERDTVIQVFGMPPEIMGILSSSNRATIEAADYLYSRWIILPRLEFFRAIIQERLIPQYDDRLILDYPTPVAEDKEFVLKIAQYAYWALTVDEWRGMMGQDPKPNGEGNVHVIGTNLRVVKTLDPALFPIPQPKQPGDQQGGNNSGGNNSGGNQQEEGQQPQPNEAPQPNTEPKDLILGQPWSVNTAKVGDARRRFLRDISQQLKMSPETLVALVQSNGVSNNHGN